MTRHCSIEHNGAGVIVGLGVLVNNDDDEEEDWNEFDEDWNEFDDVDAYEDNSDVSNDVYDDKEGLASALDINRNVERSVETSDERERDGDGKTDEEKNDIEDDSKMEGDGVICCSAMHSYVWFCCTGMQVVFVGQL